MERAEIVRNLYQRTFLNTIPYFPDEVVYEQKRFVSRISGVRRFISLPKGAVKGIVCGANKLEPN